MRKLLRELRREFPFATIETTNGNHYRIILPNGRLVIVASTPGSRFFLQYVRNNVRRQMRRRPSRDFLPHSESSS